MAEVVGIRFKDVGKIYYFDPCGEQLKKNQHIIVETARGTECGVVAMSNRDVDDSVIVKPLKPIIRVADKADLERLRENKQKELEAAQICNEKIKKHGLEMKLVDVEYTFDGSKVLFYFTADGRVDFRELVKDLASVFRMRIELRQIGVRDEAKMLGGVGTCGRGLCCNTWLRDFEPVSIKMAKVQNLSLNPSKISGMCGRLMCCLKFENEAYNYLKKGMPSVGERIKTPDGKALVTEVNILENIVKTRLILEEGDKKKGIEEKLSNEYYSYAKEEIKRLGKHKSGGGKHDDDLSNLDKDTLKEIEKLMKD